MPKVAKSKGRPLGGPSLHFTEVQQLTITRRKAGRAWAYFDATAKRITDRAEIDRLNAIALPPAYANGRFNPDAKGHLQAIGIDARGRRQYRYHAGYRASQDAQKFALSAAFGNSLPKLRKYLDTQLAADPTSRDAVIAAMIRILDTAYVRVGNEAYSRTNKSFGLTTLRNRHARLRGKTLELQYRGKGGIMRSVRLTDRSLSRIVRRCGDLLGQNLFQYRDKEGEVRPLTSSDINAYLSETMGEDFTAKHFRTWHASVIAFETLWSGYSAKDALEEVSQALGNTPAIARKSYIHPLLFEVPPDALRDMELPRATQWMSRFERGYLNWLADAGRRAK